MCKEKVVSGLVGWFEKKYLYFAVSAQQNVSNIVLVKDGPSTKNTIRDGDSTAL